MAKDIFHQAVKTALESDGWTITHDPLTVPGVGLADYYIDLGAEQVIAAERGTEKIAVEIKSFLSHSFSKDFHLAMGQYLNYVVALRNHEPDRPLYLAVPEEVYAQEFNTRHVQDFIATYSVRLIVFNPQAQTISAWKS